MVFQVGGTKKGGMPVTTEKRPRGKTVTVIGNVKGDKEELIRLLKSHLGCGGHASGHDRVEIQGDHASAIQDLLLKHGGSGAMKGVAGLKPPTEARRTDPRRETDAEENRKTEKRTAREETDRRHARESRQRAIKEATLVKPQSTRDFHVFCAMMKRWRYWDQDYDRLHEMHHRHLASVRDDDARDPRGSRGGALGASFLDADTLDDNERLQRPHPTSAVLETMRETLVRLDAVSGSVTSAVPSASAKASTLEALRALGMIAEPSPFRQTREARLAESRRNAAEARAREINEARIEAARRKGGAGSSNAPFGGRARSRARAAGAAERGRKKGAASRPTLGGFTAARKRGGLAHAWDDDDIDDDDGDGDEVTPATPLRGDRDATAATKTTAATTAAAAWDSTPGFRRLDGGGFSFAPVVGAGATPAWPQQTAGEHQSDVPSFSRAAPRAPEDPEPVSREELDLREALRLSLLEAERPPRRSAGLHVECGDVWGDLSEEEALALAMELSEQDERRRLREEREAYEAYRAEAYEADAFSRDSGDASEDARGASVEETWNDVAFSDAAFSNEASRADEGDADLAEALRLSALDAERCRDGRDASDIPRRLGDALMPEAMDEDAALREALRLSALESGGASASGVAGFADSTPGSPVAGAEETACQWAAAHLGAFTGEADNSVLAEYVVSMSRAEVEDFLGESFGDAEAAKAFARALEETR
jgi:translation initiation factor 1 (eIF-1/SUI1)